jgi:ethanolamine ammonia-lyase large subunit
MEGIIEEEEIPTGNSGLTHIVTDVELMSLGLLTGLVL